MAEANQKDKGSMEGLPMFQARDPEGMKQEREELVALSQEGHPRFSLFL